MRWRSKPGSLSTEDICKTIGTGLYVQSVSGLHSGVNPVSGDFSVGAEGLMIRDGELAEPVREITVASTIQRMLQEVIAVGDTLEWLPGAAAGVTLAIESMSVSGSLGRFVEAMTVVFRQLSDTRRVTR